MYSSSPSLRTPNNKRRRLQAATVLERDPDEDGHHHQQTGLSHGAYDDGGDGGHDTDEADPLGQEQDPDQGGDDGNQVETPRPTWTARRSVNISTNATSLHLDASPSSSPTKRPRRKHTLNSSSSASASAFVEDSDAGDSASNTSRQSGASSPIKKMAAMELSPDGLETRPFSLDDPRMPQSLADLLVEMEAYGNGEQVLLWSQKSEIEQVAKTDRRFSGFRNFMYADPAGAQSPELDLDLHLHQDKPFGVSPTVADVRWVLAEAQECQEMQQGEAGWNTAVHFPILHKAIYGAVRKKQLVGTMQCTTANMIKEYLPTNTPGKKVDFCLYLSPDEAGDAVAASVIQDYRRRLPCAVVNHTDFVPLRSRPVAVSVETKRRGADQPAEADLQMGTCHAAQWNLLSRLVMDHETGADKGNGKSRGVGGKALDRLPFLPGIVVNGHSWNFVATTREGRKTILWQERCFGDTSNPLGVYKAVAGVQRLARWARDIYWPWYRENVLGITPHQEVPTPEARV